MIHKTFFFSMTIFLDFKFRLYPYFWSVPNHPASPCQPCLFIYWAIICFISSSNEFQCQTPKQAKQNLSIPHGHSNNADIPG